MSNQFQPKQNMLLVPRSVGMTFSLSIPRFEPRPLPALPEGYLRKQIEERYRELGLGRSPIDIDVLGERGRCVMSPIYRFPELSQEKAIEAMLERTRGASIT